MIKIFRKIRQKMIAEHKPASSGSRFSRYFLYAIGEIILVVIGILIALSISNWNEQAKQRAEETRLLEKITTDLIGDINQLKGHISIAKDRQTKVDSVLVLLYNDENPDPNKFFQLNVDAIGFESHFEVNSGTFDESQSAGSIKFIQSDSLREQIFTYYRITKRNYDDENTVRAIYRDIFPVMFKKLVATKEALLGLKGIETSLPEIDIETLRKDQDYMAILLQKGISEGFQIQSWESYLTRAESLVQQIELALEEKQ